MRHVSLVVLIAMVGSVVVGCRTSKIPGIDPSVPTVDAFNGKVVRDGEPVSFPEGEAVQLMIYHESGQSFGIPLNSDGTFQIGVMPVGKYSAILERPPKSGQRGPPTKYGVPGGLTIEAGKTEYTIELGKDWKP
jgi:hypothetical protein